MKPRSYSLPVSAAVALLHEVQHRCIDVAIYPRALSNAFGELRATASEPLHAIVVKLDLETGEGSLKLKKPMIYTSNRPGSTWPYTGRLIPPWSVRFR